MKYVFIFSLMLSVAQAVYAQDKWQLADANTVRLPPAAFSQLPRNIIRKLQTRGCTVPQSFAKDEPHNVIRGEFAGRGRMAWAVLCSRNKVSSILVFWDDSPERVSEISKSPDSTFLQAMDGDGNIGFSRSIEAVRIDYTLEHYRDHGGRKPLRIDYQGINDAFAEKASVVHYYHRGRWLKLQGAD